MFVSQGLVLGKRGAGESNTVAAILTSELGLIRVAARSARVEASKLRYGLEPFTTARYSFVRGRYEWKLTGVERVSRDCVAESTTRRKQTGKIARLLLRLVNTEDPVPEVYDTVAQGFLQLVHTQDDAEAEALEWVLVLRVLSSLGYLAHHGDLESLLLMELDAPELPATARALKSLVIRSINESLAATGL